MADTGASRHSFRSTDAAVTAPTLRGRLLDWWSDALWEIAARRMAKGKRIGWIGWYALACDRPERDRD